MTYQLFTVGGGELLAANLNGVAVLLAGGKNSFFAYMAYIIGVCVATCYAAVRNDYTYGPKYFAYYIVMVGFLLGTKGTLVVTDTITGKNIPVKNLPWSLCFGVGNISRFGYELTKQYESVFVARGDMSYLNSGMVFGSKIIQDLQHIKVDDVTFQTNINSFVNQCIVSDLSMNRYTMTELKNTGNIWEFLKTRTGNGLAFSYLNPENKHKTLVPCKDGLDDIGQRWEEIIDTAANGIAAKYYGRSLSKEEAKRKFFANLDVANKLLLNASSSQAAILKQKVMVNSLRNGFANTHAKRDSAAGVQLYTAAMAKESNQNMMKTQQMLSEEQIMATRIAFMSVMIMLYPIMIFLSCMTLTGYKLFFSYLEMLLWLESWPIVFTALNFIMTYTAVDNSVALSMQHDSLLSWNSTGELADLHKAISLNAGHLMATTAALSFALIKGGAGSFVHLAGHLGNSMQSAAQGAASQLTSGSFTHGTPSLDTVNANNTNMNKHDTNRLHSADSLTTSNSLGSTTTYTPHGGKIINDGNLGGSAIDSINVSSDISRGWSEQSRQALDKSTRLSTELGENKQKGIDQMQQLSSSIEKLKSNSQVWNESFTEDERLALNKALDIKENFANKIDQNISDSVGNEKGASAGVKIMGTGTNASIKSNHQAATNESFAQLEELNKSKSFQSALNSLASVSKSKNLNINDQSADRFVEDYRETFNKASNLRESEQVALGEVEAYNQEATNATKNATTINQNASGAWHKHLENRFQNKGISPREYQALRADTANPQLRAKEFERFSKNYANNQIQSKIQDIRSNLKNQYQTDANNLKQEFGEHQLSGQVKTKAVEKGITDPVDTSLKHKVEKTGIVRQAVIGAGGNAVRNKAEIIKDKNTNNKGKIKEEVDGGMWDQAYKLKDDGGYAIDRLSNALGGRHMVDEDSIVNKTLEKLEEKERQAKAVNPIKDGDDDNGLS